MSKKHDQSGNKIGSILRDVREEYGLTREQVSERNRGLSMGVLSQAMMTPIIITVVGGTILTPILLKLAFRGHSGEPNGDGRLVDRYNKAEQLDRVSERLLQADHDLMNKKRT